MESSEEFTESSDHNRPHMVIKGQRTKRQRPSSPTTSGEIEISAGTKEEDEDMANCLILLAQGFGRGLDQTPRFNFNGYECKTCSRTFSSFQALGGHRASHKKPKTDHMEEKRVLQIQTMPPAPAKDNHEEEEQEKGDQFNSTITRSLSPANSKSLYKVHECSVCGSEFSSGQALGGHMRRHRPPNSDSRSQEQNNKPRGILTPDLNLPPPAEDDLLIRDSSFQFEPRRGNFVLSAPALVDCHY